MVFQPSQVSYTRPSQSRPSGLNKLLIGAALGLALLGLVYIIQVSSVVSLGYQLEDLQETASQLSLDANLLLAQTVQLKNQQEPEQLKQEYQLVEAKNIRYIKAGHSMSLTAR